jgi:hypothetical protein
VGESADVHILDVGPVDRQRHLIFRLARGATGVAADTLGVVDDFCPLHSRSSLFTTRPSPLIAHSPRLVARFSPLDRQLPVVPVDHPALQISHVIEAESGENRRRGRTAHSGATNDDNVLMFIGFQFSGPGG